MITSADSLARSPSTPRQRFGIQARMTLLILVVALTIAGASTWTLMELGRQQIRSDLMRRLVDLAALAAQRIDGDRHEQITAATGMDSSEYLDIRRTLQQIHTAIPDLSYVYTMRSGPHGEIRFVVDAEENAQELAPLDSIYEHPGKVLRTHFATLERPMAESDFYHDQWGTWLSGYAPIRDAAGRRVGVLGLDISAQTVLAHEQQMIRMAGAVFLGMLPLILLAGFLAGRHIAHPIVSLERGVARVRSGDLDFQLELERQDEIGILGDAFDHMTRELSAQRQQLQWILAQYRNIFDNAAEGIFQATPRGRVLTANRSFLDMLGYQDLERLRREVPDWTERLALSPQKQEELQATLVAHGTLDRFETRIRRRDGTQFCAAITLHLVEGQSGERILEGMMLDITERRRRLEAERQRQVAEAANAAKSGFLANMSHEIRTPLNAIMGLTDLVLRTDLDSRQREFLGKVQMSSRGLLALINDILDFSKIESGRLELEQTGFSLHEVIANLTEMFAYQAHEKGIELLVSIESHVPCALIGDPVRLGQILINLTGNAIKFTERGEVQISVVTAPNPPADLTADEVFLEFRVRDTGRGIAAERIEAIFDAFTQADSSVTRHHGGTGLGLAICRRLAALMGGTVTATSTPGESATFCTTARFQRQPSDRAVLPQTPLDLRGTRVLIVDDNATSREILAEQIRSFRMEALAVASGEEALAQLAAPEAHFELVLMDWKMDGINGLETTRRIRNELRLAHTPMICMVSAYAREDLMQQSERTSLDAFLHKPVNQSFLFDTIMSLFGHQETTFEQEPGTETAPSAEIAWHFPGCRVLLVEDLEINRLVASEWLNSVDIEVEVAENGRVAVAQAGRNHYDAILMDVQMPEMDGLEATRRIRAEQTQAPRVPIIAMTAHALKGDLERCLDAGMDDYISKPIDPERLFATLQRWLPAHTDNAPALARTTPPVSAGEAALLELALPGLDIGDGLRRANHNVPLYLKLLRNFAREHRDFATTLRGHLDRGEIEQARHVLHALKGVAGNLGATELYWASIALEDWLASHTYHASDTAWTTLQESLERLLEGLARLPETTASAGPGPGEIMYDAKVVEQLCATLEQQLDDDLAAATETLGQLRPCLEASAHARQYQELAEKIEAFEIDAAIELVQQLRGTVAQ